MFPESFINKDRIKTGLVIPSKKRVLEQIAELFSGIEPEITANDVYNRLLERERLGSTGLGKGIALPHARIKNLKQAHGAFLRLQQATDFDAIDKAPVDLVFALLVPENANEQHLQILATLAAFFNDEENCNKLRQEDKPENILQLLPRTTSVPEI